MVRYVTRYLYILSLFCLSIAQQRSNIQAAIRSGINTHGKSRAPQQSKQPQRPTKKPQKRGTSVPPPPSPSPQNLVAKQKQHFIKERKKDVAADVTKAVVAPFAEGSYILKRVTKCGKTWKVTPVEPSTWIGSEVFPRDGECASMVHKQETEGDPLYDGVCENNRVVAFPKCGISLIVPHKSASSMVYGIFENICGAPSFEVITGQHFSGFGFDHTQDKIQLNRSLQSTIKTTDLFSEMKATADNSEAANSTSNEGLFVVAILRDPIDRVVGMFNMMGGKSYSFGRNNEVPIYTEKEYSYYEKVWENPTRELIQARFGRFLEYYQKKPILRDKFIHFTPQARYLGVGCGGVLTKVDLIGRSERLNELFVELAKHVRLFQTALTAFISEGGNIPPWYFRMHDARGDWSMTPCDVTEAHFEQIKDMFDVDFKCFHEDVLKNTDLMFSKPPAVPSR